MSSVSRDNIARPKTDRRAAAHTLCFPADSVANGDVDTFILVVALLISDIRDQFFVVPMSDIGQVDSVHGWNPSCLDCLDVHADGA